jgi:hypothetical protein
MAASEGAIFAEINVSTVTCLEAPSSRSGRGFSLPSASGGGVMAGRGPERISWIVPIGAALFY